MGAQGTATASAQGATPDLGFKLYDPNNDGGSDADHTIDDSTPNKPVSPGAATFKSPQFSPKAAAGTAEGGREQSTEVMDFHDDSEAAAAKSTGDGTSNFTDNQTAHDPADIELDDV